MEITDDNVLTMLTSNYVTTTSAVLLCEVVDELKAEIDHWEIYINDIFYALASNSDSNVHPKAYLYARLLELDRDTDFTAYVIAVNGSGVKSQPSNTVEFRTFPKF